MNLFIVLFQEAIASEWQSHIPYSHPLRANDAFVISPHAVIFRLNTSDPSLLKQAFGMSEDVSEPTVGAVFKLNGTYSGYYDTELWEWLAVVRADHEQS